jgi:MSHA biogenesis protein MshN
MGLPEMSLINQMLQDLDERRSEVTGGDVSGHHIRAVPPRRRLHLHAAWWVALVLGALLTGVLAWALSRPAPIAALAPAPAQPIASPSLPLRLDLDMELLHPAMEQAAVARGTADVGPDAAIAPAIAAVNRVQDEQAPSIQSNDESPGRVQAVSATEGEKRALPSKPPAPATPIKSMAPAPVPDLAPVTSVKPTVTAAKAWEPAVAVTKQIKELTPQQRAENEYRKATILLQQGKSAEAIDGLEQALQFDPQHAAARQVLVGALLDAARQDDGIRKAREGLAIDPAQPGLAMILARLQLDKGELKPALDTLERTLPYAADRADYQSFLAALLQRGGRHKDAAEHFLLALQKTPQNGVWWMGLGISLQAEHRLPESQDAFIRAKASNTLSPELLAFVESKLKQLQR